jgi:hypothetical protein
MTSPTLTDDLPFVKALYEQDCSRSLVACHGRLVVAVLLFVLARLVRAAAVLPHRKADGRSCGHHLVIDREMWDDMFMIDELVVVEGQSLRAVMPSVLRALRPLAQAQAAERKVSLKSLYWRVGREHPVFEAIPELLPKSRPPYGWYIRVADLPGFLRHIAPALEARGPLAMGYTSNSNHRIP